MPFEPIFERPDLCCKTESCTWGTGCMAGRLLGMELTVCSGMERGTKLFRGRSARVGRGCLAIFRGKILSRILSPYRLPDFLLRLQLRRQRCEIWSRYDLWGHSLLRQVGESRRTVRSCCTSRWLETGDGSHRYGSRRVGKSWHGWTLNPSAVIRDPKNLTIASKAVASE